MPIHKGDRTAPVVARHRATPVRVVVRDAAGVGGIVARVVKDPAAGFFRRAVGHALERISGVDWLSAGIRQVGDAGRFEYRPRKPGHCE